MRYRQDALNAIPFKVGDVAMLLTTDGPIETTVMSLDVIRHTRYAAKNDKYGVSQTYAPYLTVKLPNSKEATAPLVSFQVPTTGAARTVIGKALLNAKQQLTEQRAQFNDADMWKAFGMPKEWPKSVEGDTP